MKAVTLLLQEVKIGAGPFFKKQKIALLNIPVGVC